MSTISLKYEVGAFPQSSRDALELGGEDPFYREEILNMLWDKQWLGIEISEGRRRFTHAIAPCAIAKSHSYDVEPFTGYGGPICTSDDLGFITEACACYSDWCRRHHIVAELVRFSPHLQNASFFHRVPNLKIAESRRRIAYMPLHLDERDLLAEYTADFQQRLQVAKNSFEVRVVDKTSHDWDVFAQMYFHWTHAFHPHRQCQWQERVLKNAREVDGAILIAAYAGDAMASAALFLAGRPVSYQWMTADNLSAARTEDADGLVLHTGATLLAGMGAKAICLDESIPPTATNQAVPLKDKVASESLCFSIGFWSHQPAGLRNLYVQAEAFDPTIHNQNLFLRYRLAIPFAAGRMKADLKLLEIETPVGAPVLR